MKKIRWKVFLPPWLLMIAIFILNITNYDAFIKTMDICTNWILSNFTGGFCLIAFISVILIIVTYFSPIGKVCIGGEGSEPIVNYRNYVWISLCTIMAAGILFWACAEPMYHIFQTPEFITDGAGSTQAIEWAMNTMYLEWTFTPMCIYGLPAILFAFVFYNMKLEFSLGSMIVPLIGEKYAKKIMPIIDSICLFALCAGMSASLGQGILLLGGGVESLSNGIFKSGAAIWIICTIIIVIMFIVSAASGVKKGIRILSCFNSKLYIIIGIFVFLFGPTIFIINFGIASVGNYFSDFLKISLFTGALGGSEWVQSWPGFYWCNWLAWMPITAVFLGKISKGYTVKQIINTIIIIPALFSMFWIMLFSGTSIYNQLHGYGVYEAMQAAGTEAATYSVLDQLPLSKIITALFLLIVLISFVTAADSNTNAMSSLCTDGLTAQDTESPIKLKIVWGITIGVICIIMLTSYGIDGIKKMSNLGGFPDAFLMVLFIISWIKILTNPNKYNKV